MNKNQFLLLLSLGFTALAFFLGRESTSAPSLITAQPDESGHAEELSDLKAQLDEKDRQMSALLEKSSAATIQPLLETELQENENPYAKMTPDQIRAALRNAFQDPNPITRSVAFANVLANLSAENIEAVKEVYQDIPLGFENMHEYQLLLYGWGKFDATGAIAYCNERATGVGAGFATAGVLHGWASEDPKATLAWVEDPENEGMAKIYNFGLVRGWASNDLPGATQYVAGLEQGGDRHELVKILTTEHLKQGFTSTLQWAESMDDANMKKSAFTNLAQQRSREHPEEVAQWLKQHAGKPYSEASFGRLGDNWGQRDPQAAADYFDELPAGAGKTEGMREVVEHWAKEEPADAGDWLLKKEPSSDLDPVYASYAREVSNENGEGAMEWAQTITEPKLKEKTITSVGQNWYRQDKAKVEAWLPDSGLPDKTQQAIQKPPKQNWWQSLRPKKSN
ncbi:MAG: hypothetical protein VB980_07205 [Opitutales bacterium]